MGSMDAIARRMMADLGSERRDFVSAPDADARGRMIREDPREQAAVRADVQARRARITGPPGADENKVTTSLRAWNTEANFVPDESVKDLENRYSGQGHRAALKSRFKNNDPWEAIEVRFGEERRIYLQEHGANPADYLSSAPPRPGADGFRQLLGGKGPASRSFSDGQRSLVEDRRRPSPPRPSNHARAPSPRSFGTTRFEPGGRRVEPTSAGSRVVSQPVAQVNGTGRPLASATPPIQQRLPNGHTAQPNGTSIAGSNTSAAATHDRIQTQVYKNRALMWAAEPGEACDEYHRLHPDRLQYLGPARAQLIRDAIALAKNNHQADTAAYLKVHPERTWMVEAAAKAKSQVENDSEDTIEAYCTAFPKHRDFIHAAKAHFTQKTKQLAEDAQKHSIGEDKSISDVKWNGSSEQHITSKAGPPETSAVQHSLPAAAESSESDRKSSVDTAISAPAQSNQGTLAATFFDIAGAFLGIHQTSIQAPVQVNMNITSRARRFDPRELIHSIEALAQSMVNKSQGLGGAKLADDGLWEEEEEEL